MNTDKKTSASGKDFENLARSCDWVEDFKHENGDYWNVCVHCNRQFRGHKRRVCCKLCFFTPPSPDSLDAKPSDDLLPSAEMLEATADFFNKNLEVFTEAAFRFDSATMVAGIAKFTQSQIEQAIAADRIKRAEDEAKCAACGKDEIYHYIRGGKGNEDKDPACDTFTAPPNKRAEAPDDLIAEAETFFKTNFSRMYYYETPYGGHKELIRLIASFAAKQRMEAIDEFVETFYDDLRSGHWRLSKITVMAAVNRSKNKLRSVSEEMKRK